MLTSTVPTLIDGTCQPKFSQVRRAFEHNFTKRGEVGAAVAVVCDGAKVVDLWGGFSDESCSIPWHETTIANFYSAGKPIVATMLLRELESSDVDLDTPMIDVWPEFAASGKEHATIRHALCHRAGVPAIDQTLTNDDLWSWPTMTAALAQTRPWFEPGTRHIYHTNTYGHLIGELLRRLGDATPHDALELLASSLEADLHFGVNDTELARCADIILDSKASPATLPPDDGSEGSMVLRSYFNPPGYSSFGVVNSAHWRGAEVPSTNGHGSARGLARFYSALLESDRVLSPPMLAEATSVQSTGPCPVLGEEVSFGLGFQRSSPRRPFGPTTASFGHFGTGGAVGFADPEAGIAVGYVMNHVIPRWQSTRNRALIDAVYASL